MGKQKPKSRLGPFWVSVQWHHPALDGQWVSEKELHRDRHDLFWGCHTVLQALWTRSWHRVPHSKAPLPLGLGNASHFAIDGNACVRVGLLTMQDEEVCPAQIRSPWRGNMQP